MDTIIDQDVSTQFKDRMDKRIKKQVNICLADDSGVVAIAIKNVNPPTMSRLDALASKHVDLTAKLNDINKIANNLVTKLTTLQYPTPDTYGRYHPSYRHRMDHLR